MSQSSAYAPTDREDVSDEEVAPPSSKRSINDVLGAKSLNAGATRAPAATKRARVGPSAAEIRALSLEQLQAATHDELVAWLRVLQTDKPAPDAMTPEQLAAKVERARSTMARGIQALMVWRPSAKHGGAKFSFSGQAGAAEVIERLFGFDKKKKMLKLPVADFQDRVIGGYIEASIRYGYLRLTGSTVLVRFDRESNEFTVSGTYGL